MQLTRDNRCFFHGLGFAAEKIGRSLSIEKHKLAEGWGREERGIGNWTFLVSKN
jgi:hypothetical protein